MAIDYKSAGVDIAAGDALVDWLKETQPKNLPHADRLVAGIGGFASLFRADFPKMKEPCLVTCTDGVGTKLKVATHFEDYSTIGQDLVAMCVNDMICCGAQPLLFLDYYATGKLELEAAKSFLAGVRQACIDSDCLLIGGETAEMPGVYREGDFDCAGFSVGVVDREAALGAHRVSSGDRLVGVASSGFHSNGFSLLRKVFAEDMDNWREALLEPTALYVKLANSLLKEDLLNAAANITGGGIDNILRVVPKGSVLNLQKWDWPENFLEVQKRTGLDDVGMLKTLNCGLGLALIVSKENEAKVHEICSQNGHKSWALGEVHSIGEADSRYEWV